MHFGFRIGKYHILEFASLEYHEKPCQPRGCDQIETAADREIEHKDIIKVGVAK